MGGDFMGKAIGWYAAGDKTVDWCQIVHEGSDEQWHTAEEIIEECRRQASLLDPEYLTSPAIELRLRKLVALAMDMRALGLIE